jgi:hypothetical protein
LGLVGCAIAVIVDVSYSTFHDAARMLGDATLDRTHGFIGFGLVVVGVVGSILALFMPVPAAILLLIAGIGLFFVVKGYAIFSILFFVLAAIFAFIGRHHHHEESAQANVAGS